jgi:hypothetical protein
VQVIESEPVGKDVPTKDFDDASLADIQGIPDSAAHREIDLECVATRGPPLQQR